MRWLGLLVISLVVATARPALAVPQPDAEAAFARGDYTTAFNLFMPLAEQGSVQAQERIAEMYDKGLGVPQDPAKAKEWYRRAAEQSAQDAEMKMEASQGMAAPGQSVPPTVVLGTASRAPAVAPLTPMPHTAPIVYPAAWPPARPAVAPAPQPFFLPYRPTGFHHHHFGGHHR